MSSLATDFTVYVESSVRCMYWVFCRNALLEAEFDDAAKPVELTSTELHHRPKRLSLSGTTDTVEGSPRATAAVAVWNNSPRRFSVDVLPTAALTADGRRPPPSAVDRFQLAPGGRGRTVTRASRLQQMGNQRRTSQPRARQSVDDFSRRTGRRFSDNGAALNGRDRDADGSTQIGTGTMQMTAFGRRQSVQSNPPDQRSTTRRSSEGHGVDTWWAIMARRRQSSSSSSRGRQNQLDDEQHPASSSTHYRKRRSAPEVTYTSSRRRRESTASSSGRRDAVQAEAARWQQQRRRNARLDSFDSALASGLPSPTESVASGYSSAASLSDIARGGRRKDSGFRSIETQSSYGASRKSSTSGGGGSVGLRRQSIQTDVSAGRRESIPFVANPFELPGRSASRAPMAGPRSSGRRQSMFTSSDEVGGRDSGWNPCRVRCDDKAGIVTRWSFVTGWESRHGAWNRDDVSGRDNDWLNEWIRWRSGCSEATDVDLPNIERRPTSSQRDATGVWNSLSEKVERTFGDFNDAISRAAALLNDRRISSDSASHIDC